VCSLAASCCAMNTEKLVDWYFYNTENTTDHCTPVNVNSCVYCGGYYYSPYTCYGFDDCYYNSYYDAACTQTRSSYYYAYEGNCENVYYGNYSVCQMYYTPPQFSQCGNGCDAPVFDVKSDAGVSVYHAPYADGPTYVTQTSENEVSVAGRIRGHYYKDGYGNRMAFEGFLSQTMYLTTAGYCNVGEWCNSTTTMQYKLDMEEIVVDNESNYIGFHPYASAAFVSTDYNESPVNIVVPSGDHISYLSVDSDWDLSNYQMNIDIMAGSLSGLLPIIIHNQGSLSHPNGITYSDMLFVPQGSSGDGLLAYKFQIASFGIYRRGYCEGEGYSSSIPVCYMDGSFDDDFMVQRVKSSDEMSFTLL